ncbi:MAG: histidinol dehydrogenase [Pseudomonadota bacterium]
MDAPARPELRRLALDGLSQDAYAALLRRTENDLTAYIEKITPILDRVRAEGDTAVAEFGRTFDHADISAQALQVEADAFDAAETRLDPDLKTSMRFAAERIRAFHQAQMPEDMWLKEMGRGVFAGDRWTAIPSVGCYVPRGKGAFPSAALMTTIPAAVAGVPEIIVLTPPTPDGGADDATLFACRLAGIDRVFKAGGAQAVAACAYGTATIPRIAKLVGPGSPWMTCAKRMLSDRIDPGMNAGPSESIVFADGTTPARTVALDLLNEAEHGPDSAAYLVTTDPAHADAVAEEVLGLLSHMSEERAGYALTVLSGPQGGILLAPDTDTACRFINDFAPEHLMVQSKDPFRYLSDLKHAGEILLGEHSAISIANFVIGPNHVLPTGGAARTGSPLSVFDFLKRQTIVHLTRDGYDLLADHAGRFARYEGFDAHANAVSPLRDGKE